MESKRSIFDRSCLNCITYLENHPECSAVRFNCEDGASKYDISSWESKNYMNLPKDFRRFLLVFNGCKLEWDARVVDRFATIGRIRICRINEFVERAIVGHYKLSGDGLLENGLEAPDPMLCKCFVLEVDPFFGDTVMLFRKNTNTSISDVCGDYQNGNYLDTEIWFVDLSSRWHYLCASFTQYLRLAVVHCGISGWKLAFTPEGIPPALEHCFSIFCKERLCLDRQQNDNYGGIR